MIKVVIFEIYASLLMLDVAMYLVVEGDSSSDIVKKYASRVINLLYYCAISVRCLT